LTPVATTHTVASDSPLVLAGGQEFSLVLGGPLFQLLRRARLSDDALTLARERIISISLFSWLPLLVLSLVEGQAFGGKVTIPFLLDADVHARFLVAMPLLVAAELVVHRRMRAVAQVFLDRHLIPEASIPTFQAAVTSTVRLRNSILAEVLLIALVYGVGILVIWRNYTALDAATWYATPSATGTKASLAGLWYGYVSLPIFQFLLLRWYFRLVIWVRFLWKVSRIELCLAPTHPDRVGGLGFLAGTAYAFTLLAVAHGALLAGQLANRIFFMGAALTDYKMQIAVVVGFIVVIVLGPLTVFAGQLARAKQKGLREFGTLAERYVREFDDKWLRGAAGDEPFIGSADIQSLADLGNSYEVVKTMRFAPVTKEAAFQLAMVTVAPIAPLLLTIMPLEQLLKTLLGVLF
jgi:hypothetical protein